MAAVTEHSAETKKLKNKARASLALLLIAVISISTATYAWFTLSNSTSVQSMIIEVGTGTTLKAYAGKNTSEDVADYFAVIKSEGKGTIGSGDVITDALPKKADYPNLADNIKSLNEIKLWPVTSGNGVKLYTEGLNGEVGSTGSGPEKKYYVQLTLTFISDTTMDVYLNGSNSITDATPEEADGTLVESAVKLDGAKPGGGKYTQADVNAAKEPAANAIKSLRVSFEDVAAVAANPKTPVVIWEPDNKDKNGTVQTTTLAGLALKDLRQMTDVPAATKQVTFTHLGDNSGIRKDETDASVPLFSLEADIPKVIKIRMWVEGEDAQCINDPEGINIEKALLSIRFRFCGADPDTGDFIETAPR